MGVENVGQPTTFTAASVSLPSFFPVQLSVRWKNARHRLAEEPHESLDVLGYGGQEELLADEPQSPQAQATQSNLILEFRKQGLNFLWLALCLGELGRAGEFACALSCWLMYVDGQ